MSEIKFNSQVYTSRSQSERLLALGLKKETADFPVWGTEGLLYMAWSLHRLIEMMPITLIEDKVYHERWELNITPIWVIYRNQDMADEWIGECLGQGMYNNIIDCIEWLIKEGYFPNEYLV